MPRRRLKFDKWPAAVYAVGDVHGCLAQLLNIEQQLVADAAPVRGTKWIVMLGDYLDRGPQSAQVIDHLLETAPAGFERFCLAGNHETMMLDFIDDPAAHSYWLEQGGLETLQSYSIRALTRGWHGTGDQVSTGLRIPEEHIRFLRGLPISLSLPGCIFVHAGIRPGVAISEQTDDDLVWIREPFLSSALPGGSRVVHGHTPAWEPVVTPYRICLDTQCFLTGRLTAARVGPNGQLSFFASSE